MPMSADNPQAGRPKLEFNAVDVINKTYANSTEYDLNDALIFLTKAINKTKVRNKQLVKQHFGKFVQCRAVLEEIWTDIKQKGYDKEFTSDLESNIKVIEEKFKDITSGIFDDGNNEVNRSRREYYTKRYALLFNIKLNLRRNLHNLERFVDIYRDAARMYEELRHSVYAQKIWSSIHDERCEFLETIYRSIQRPGCSFHEALYYFDLYFKVCEHKSEHKIMNTLLVNFKENSARSLELSCLDEKECLDEVTKHYLKLIGRVNEKIQIQGTDYYFWCIEKILYTRGLFFSKVWIKKLRENVRMVQFSTDARAVYFSHLKRVKTKVIDGGFQDIPNVTVDTFGDAMEHLQDIFNLFADIVSKEEKRYLRSKVLEYVNNCYESVELKKFSDLDTVIKNIYGIRHLLGSPDSEDVKDLYRMIARYMENHTTRIVGLITEMIGRKASDVQILMEVVRIIEEMPMEHLRIIRRIKPLVENRPVAMYYLSNILSLEPPRLSNDLRKKVDEIRDQFGFLLSV
ncbi:putative exocyst complex component [Encephalitozoon cuniculi]|nr:putative exocyst complex component [Encephalitozoon cuniculi]